MRTRPVLAEHLLKNFTAFTFFFFKHKTTYEIRDFQVGMVRKIEGPAGP